MNPYKPLFFVFDMIRHESAPWQVSLAVVMGAFIAISPALSPQMAIALLFLCLVKVNLLVLPLAIAFFSALSMPLEAWFDQLGKWILVDVEELRRMWAGLYHWPIFPFTEFNNTVVMGGLLVFAVAAVPLFFLSHLAYRIWGKRILLRIQHSNLGLALRATVLFRRYDDHILRRKRNAS